MLIIDKDSNSEVISTIFDSHFEVWVVTSGNGRTVVDGMEQYVRAGDVITMSAGCRHTILADTELKLVEVQLGKDIDSSDKEKFVME